MRILLVEDNAERQLWFLTQFAPSVDIDIAWVAPAAVALLQAHQYDAIYLDHDLLPHHNGFEDDGSSGYEVAKFLCANPPTCPIIIHSQNIYGSTRIAELLRAAGVNCVQEPFPPSVATPDDHHQPQS